MIILVEPSRWLGGRVDEPEPRNPECRNPECRNEVLCSLLEQLGWSLSGFARRLRGRCEAIGRPGAVSPSTVLRWRDGAVPGPELVGPACDVLSVALRRHITPEVLGWPGISADVAAEALQYGDLPHAVRVLSKLWQLDSTAANRAAMQRMSFGGTVGPASHEALAMLADVELAGPGRQRVSSADVELLESHTDLYARLDARYGGGRFRGVFAAFLDMHATPLLGGAFTARLGRRLYGSVADAVFALAAMAYDDRLPGLAQRYDLQAMRLAQAVGDRARMARGHIHQARLAAARGEAAQVLIHARSAVHAAVGAPASVKAYVAIAEARAWAFNERPEQTLAAVHRARDAFGRARSDTTPRWLRGLDRAELEGQATWALVMAGLAGPGQNALEAAMDMPEERARDHLELLITTAELARLRGDPGERAAALDRAVAAAKHLKSRRLAARLAAATRGEVIHDF